MEVLLGKQERIYVKLEERQGIVQRSGNMNGLVKCSMMDRWYQGIPEVSGHEFKEDQLSWSCFLPICSLCECEH